MKFFKDHVAPTLHQAIGGLITLGILAVAGLLLAFVKPFRDGVVEFALSLVPVWSVVLLMLPVALGWFLFLRTLRRLRSVERQLRDAQSHPHRFRDDCTFDKRLGLYRHKSKPEFFCGTCTLQDIESPLKELEHGWQCLIDKKHWHPNPDYKAPQPQAIYTPWRRTGFLP